MINMIKYVAITALSFLLPFTASAQECVVLLHGYARSNTCMEPLEIGLTKEGYNVINLSYPTMKYPVEIISRDHIHPHIEKISDCEKLHFIGHSLGGIVARYYLSQNEVKNLGKVILITTPNQGSRIATEMESNEFLSALLGPAVSDLAEDSPLLKSLPEPDYEVGVIAATKSINPLTSIFVLQGEDDGTLTVESMRLTSTKHYVAIPSTHTLVLRHPDLLTQIKSFLTAGKFKNLLP